jgi:4-hydroxy-tetrahydrodipicolinate synthase
MSRMTLHCRSITTFAKDGGIDEDAFRQFLQRFVDNNLGVYLDACGPCEGFTLTRDEISLTYKIGAEVCKGRVFIGGNGAEQHTADETLAVARIGQEAGMDAVNIYGPAGWHGFRPNDEEYLHFFDRILGEFKYPTAIAPNPILGYTPSPVVMAQICNKYSQVVAVNFAGITDHTYFINFMDALTREVETYVIHPGSFNLFALGATGMLGVEANVIPKTFRRYLDCYEDGNLAEATKVYADLARFTQLVKGNPAWGQRWIKVAMKIFKLPGAEGGVREPYLMPSDCVIEEFARQALALNIPEINEMGRAVGLL